MIDSYDSDHPHDECGVIGVFAPHEDVARMTFFGLYALQHRGQEACGIAVSNGASISLHKDIGLVSQVLTRKTWLRCKDCTRSVTRVTRPPVPRPRSIRSLS